MKTKLNFGMEKIVTKLLINTGGYLESTQMLAYVEDVFSRKKIELEGLIKYFIEATATKGLKIKELKTKL